MYSHLETNPIDRNLAQEQELGAEIYNLCIQAGILTTQKNPADEKSDEVKSTQAFDDLKAKRTTAMKTAINAVLKLDTVIESLKSLSYSLSKKNILEKYVYTPPSHTDLESKELTSRIISPQTILDCAIEFRYTTLLNILQNQGVLLLGSLYFAALRHNYEALLAIKEDHPLQYKAHSARLLLAALHHAPRGVISRKDQISIVTDLLKATTPEEIDNLKQGFIETPSYEPEFHNVFAVLAQVLQINIAEALSAADRNPLQLAALVAQSPELVDLLIPHTAAIANKSLLVDLINLTNQKNIKKISQILTSLLTHDTFDAEQLSAALLKAICSNYVKEAPEIITLLESKGAVATAKQLNIRARETLIVASTAAYSNLPKLQIELVALCARGADLNPTFTEGNVNLNYAETCGHYDILVAVLRLCYFSPEQLNIALTTNAKKALITPVKTLTYLEHGGDLQFTKTNNHNNLILFFLKAYMSEDDLKSRSTTTTSNSNGPQPIDEKNFEDMTQKVFSMSTNGIDNLSKEECSQMLIFLAPHANNVSALFFHVLDLLLKKSTEIYQKDSDGRTLLYHLVKAKNEKGVALFCQQILDRNLPTITHGSFYYKDDTFALQDTVESIFDKIEWNETTDLFLLAQANAAITDSLMKIKFAVNDETLKYYNKTGFSRAPRLQEHQTALQKKTKHTIVLPDEKLEPEESELKSIPKINTGSDLTYSITELQTLTSEQFISSKPKNLALALNKLIEIDMETRLNNPDYAFTYTIQFLLNLQKARFDYITILTDKTYFPLRALATTIARISKLRPKLEAEAIAAAEVLLANAPYSQLKKLRENEKEYDALLKSLPTPFKQHLEKEIKKPRATLGDLAFYLKQRSKNPDDRFYERVPCFNEIVAFENKAEEKNEAPPTAKERQTFYDKVRSKTTVAFFAGETTRIIDAMQQEEKHISNAANPNYLTRLRFSSMAAHRFIVHTKEEINNVLDEHNKNRPDPGYFMFY